MAAGFSKPNGLIDNKKLLRRIYYQYHETIIGEGAGACGEGRPVLQGESF